MRRNTRKVLDAWFQGNPLRETDSIWTDGERIYSYETALVEKMDNGVRMNVTKYSYTTTVHQNSIYAELLGTTYDIDEMVDIPMGTKTFSPEATNHVV